MKRHTVILHHTAFHRADRDGDYGRRTLQIAAEDKPVTGLELAELAFYYTNHPNPRPAPREIERSGRCYSLSFGDVVETQTNGGELFMCVDIGFRQITAPQFARLLAIQKREQEAKPDVHWNMGWHGEKLLDMWEIDPANA
jgi:hypothetical protein